MDRWPNTSQAPAIQVGGTFPSRPDGRRDGGGCTGRRLERDDECAGSRLLEVLLSMMA
jgi:hypothetical protein